LKIEGDWITFSSTGRKIFANEGVIGLGPRLDVHQGCYGQFKDGGLTHAEKNELADYTLNG